MSLVFVSLWSILVAQPVDTLLPEPYDPFFESLYGLLSLDPQERVRSAWLRPDFAVKGEQYSIDGWRTRGLRCRMDGVALWDLESDETAVHLPRSLLSSASLVNENSNITQVLSLDSRTLSPKWRIEASGLYPFYADSGHTGDASVFFSIPLGSKLCVSFDGEALKWSERPVSVRSSARQGMAGYTGVASAFLAPSPGMLVQVRLLRSTEQRDYFSPAWFFNLASTPSSFSLVDLLLFDYRYSKGILDLEMSLSSYNSNLIYGGRGSGKLSPFKPYPSLDSLGQAAQRDVRNPFGVKGLFYSSGTYPQQSSRNSLVDRAIIKTSVKIGEVHKIKGSIEYAGTSIYAETKSWLDNQENTSSIQQSPRCGEFYLADRMRWDSAWLEPGLGVLYLEGDSTAESDVDAPFRLSLEPSVHSFLMLGGVNIAASVVLASQTPPLGLFYEGIADAERTDSLMLIPHLTPAAERAFKAQVGAQKRFNEHLLFGIQSFATFGYKLAESDTNPSLGASDSIPSAGVFMKGRSRAFGLEPWITYSLSWMDVAIAYRFSSAKATSAGFDESYASLLRGDTSSGSMARLPLDSRHKFVFQSRFKTPEKLGFLARDWFISPSIALQSGFPDEVGDDGKTPWWAWCEVAAGRVIKIGPVSTEIKAEFLNPFGWTGPVIGELPASPLPGEGDFPSRVFLGDSDYRSSRDANHDGVITAAEETQAYRLARRFYDAWTPSPIPWRSVELKLTFRF